MAFKINKAEQKRIADLALKLEGKFADIKAIIEKAQADLADEVAEFNETREELRGVIEDIHAEREGEYDEKSDNWRDSERGSATDDWLSSISDLMSEVEEDLAIEIEEVEKPDYLTTLTDEGLPPEPEY